MQDDFEQGITLGDLIGIVLKKWWIIVLSVLLCFIISAFYSYNYLDDYYIAESSMIIQVTNTTDSNYTNLLTGQRLVDTYSEIASSYIAIEALKENLGLSLTHNQIKDMVSVNGINDTLIIKLQVKSEEPVLAALIANELVNIVQDLSNRYEGLESIELLDPAFAPSSASGPNRVLNMVIGVLLGGIIGCAVIFIMEVFNRDFKNSKDIEGILGLKVLGVIPDYINPKGKLK